MLKTVRWGRVYKQKGKVNIQNRGIQLYGININDYKLKDQEMQAMLNHCTDYERDRIILLHNPFDKLRTARNVD